MILFVYGSLRKGFHNHSHLSNATFLGNGSTVDTYFMTGRLNTERDEFEDGRQFSYPPRKFLFPYMYTTNKEHSYPVSQTIIHGELYDIDPKCIDALDHHEGHPTIYKRSIIPVKINESIMDANVYILENEEIIDEITRNKHLFIPIPNGDWHISRLIKI